MRSGGGVLISIPYAISLYVDKPLKCVNCDIWQVQRQTYGYLPSYRASLPLDQYQIMLSDERGKCTRTTYPRFVTTAGTPELSELIVQNCTFD